MTDRMGEMSRILGLLHLLADSGEGLITRLLNLVCGEGGMGTGGYSGGSTIISGRDKAWFSAKGKLRETTPERLTPRVAVHASLP